MVSDNKFDLCPQCNEALRKNKNGYHCIKCEKGWYPEDSFIHEVFTFPDETIGTIDSYQCFNHEDRQKAYIKKRVLRWVCEEEDHTYFAFQCRGCTLEQVIYYGGESQEFILSYTDDLDVKTKLKNIFIRGTEEYKKLVAFINDLMIIVENQESNDGIITDKKEIGEIDEYNCSYCQTKTHSKVIEQIIKYPTNTIRYYIIKCEDCQMREVYNMGDEMYSGGFSDTNEEGSKNHKTYISEGSGPERDLLKRFIDEIIKSRE